MFSEKPVHAFIILGAEEGKTVFSSLLVNRAHRFTDEKPISAETWLEESTRRRGHAGMPDLFGGELRPSVECLKTWAKWTRITMKTTSHSCAPPHN